MKKTSLLSNKSFSLALLGIIFVVLAILPQLT